MFWLASFLTLPKMPSIRLRRLKLSYQAAVPCGSGCQNVRRGEVAGGDEDWDRDVEQVLVADLPSGGAAGHQRATPPAAGAAHLVGFPDVGVPAVRVGDRDDRVQCRPLCEVVVGQRRVSTPHRPLRHAVQPTSRGPLRKGPDGPGPVVESAARARTRPWKSSTVRPAAGGAASRSCPDVRVTDCAAFRASSLAGRVRVGPTV